MLAMPQGATPNAASLIEDELDVLVRALQRLGNIFPIAGMCHVLCCTRFMGILTVSPGIYAAKVQEDRVASRQSSFVPPVI